MLVCDLINDAIRRKALTRILVAKIVIIAPANGTPALFTYAQLPTPGTIERFRLLIASGKIEGELVNGADDTVLARARALV